MSLDELFALDEGFPESAGEFLPEGPLPSGEEARVLARIGEKAGTALPGRGRGKPAKKTKFGLALFAAALVLGTMIASAAAYLQPEGPIAGMLGVGAEGWQQFLRRNGAALGPSQDCGGWTLAVSQAVGDGSCAYILLDLTAPEGVVLDAERYQLDFELSFPGFAGGSMTHYMLKDDDKTDNHISYMLEITADNWLFRPRTGRLTVGGLAEVVDHGPGVDSDLIPCPADPSWELEVPLRFKNRRVVYRPRKTLEVEGGTVKVRKVEITTLSATVKLTSKDGGLGRWVVGELTSTPPPPVVTEMRLLDEDGNPIPVDSWSGGSSGEEGIITRSTHTMLFRPVIDPDKVSALLIGGVVVPLK